MFFQTIFVFFPEVYNLSYSSLSVVEEEGGGQLFKGFFLRKNLTDISLNFK